MTDLKKNTIEVCFSPKLFPDRLTKENYIVVIVDILRATTSICTAFKNGVKAIIPVATIEEAYEYKKKGYIIASERDGKVTDFADFGNSAFNFTVERVKGKTIIYSTTNGTQAIEMAKSAKNVVIGSFINLKSLTEWLVKHNKNVVILCAGWKNKFNLEDSIFAGVLVENLLKYPIFKINCDSASAALDLWKLAKTDLLGFIEKAAHRHRLKKLGLDDVLEYSFTLNTSDVVPVLDDKIIKDVNNNSENL
ncbi:MAG: 2-phosphosulfolactate phosphatase [Bacteroidales bacterium]|nr:2-phosphosulfolactate phosphatase [Bacteroidales bacterium]